MRTAAIVQARMGSTRLPGKVLMRAAGLPLLQHELQRVSRAKRIGEIVVATTREPADDPIAALCRKLGCRCMRGDEADVLGRYAEAAKACQADAIVRLTGDCPLIDPAVIDRVTSAFLDRSTTVDYASNTLVRTDPRGLDTEVFSAEALQRTAREADQPAEREHVTLYMYRHPDRFRLLNVPGARDLQAHRWTVDTPEDFELVSRILAALYPQRPHFGTPDVLALLDRNPAWLSINADIAQKDT
ncbi:cytidylyltransferase domain-containing protein [Cohnella sp. GCM10012308]|uniref:cytidylyltransferase domain-containing protein n=1 Tax=Cohnella sp. GCM10012308 TaxID=3317329 RepID=UPI00361C05E7